MPAENGDDNDVRGRISRSFIQTKWSLRSVRQHVGDLPAIATCRNVRVFICLYLPHVAPFEVLQMHVAKYMSLLTCRNTWSNRKLFSGSFTLALVFYDGSTHEDSQCIAVPTIGAFLTVTCTADIHWVLLISLPLSPRILLSIISYGTFRHHLKTCDKTSNSYFPSADDSIIYSPSNPSHSLHFIY